MSNDQHEERAPETVEEFYGRLRGRIDPDWRERFDELARRTDAFCERLEPLAEEYRIPGISGP